jgi:hypothetical protein
VAKRKDRRSVFSACQRKDRVSQLDPSLSFDVSPTKTDNSIKENVERLEELH